MTALSRISTRATSLVEGARARWPWFEVALGTFKRFTADDGGSYTAALTYYMFFSLFPIMLFSASIVGFITAGNEALRATILQTGLNSVPLLRDVLSPDHLETIVKGRGTLALTGTFMALYAGTGAVVALQHALNRFYGITDEPNWFVKRIHSLRYLAMFGVAVILSLALGGLASFATNIFASHETLGGRRVEVAITGEDQVPPTATINVGGKTFKPAVGETFAGGYVLESIDSQCATVSLASERDTLCVLGGRGFTRAAFVGLILGHLTGFLVGLLIFACAYKFLPAIKADWREVLPGAVIAALAFELLKQFGAGFLARGSANRAATFGVFAISAALLVACFLMALVTLMAAEVNNVLIERRTTRQNRELQPKGG